MGMARTITGQTRAICDKAQTRPVTSPTASDAGRDDQTGRQSRADGGQCICLACRRDGNRKRSNGGDQRRRPRGRPVRPRRRIKQTSLKPDQPAGAHRGERCAPFLRERIGKSPSGRVDRAQAGAAAAIWPQRGKGRFSATSRADQRQEEPPRATQPLRHRPPQRDRYDSARATAAARGFHPPPAAAGKEGASTRGS